MLTLTTHPFLTHSLIWIEYIALVPIFLAGILLAMFNLPGLWLMAAALATYDWLTGWGKIVHPHAIIALLVMAALGELIDLVAASGGARRAGASGAGMIGAVIGGILGGLLLSIPIPLGVGAILGICLGCFAGAALAELLMGKPLSSSLKIGLGAARGRLVGIICKLIIGLVMTVIALVCAFP
jgi:uncharacterized protein